MVKGRDGMQYMKKSFTNYPVNTDDMRLSVMSEDDRGRLDKQEKEIPVLTPKPNGKHKKIIPFGEKILVQRQRVGSTLGSGILLAAEETADRQTELAKVVAIPDITLCDEKMLGNAEEIINTLFEKKDFGGLMKFNEFLRFKTLKVGDTVFIGKYRGVDFEVKETKQLLSVVAPEEVIGLMVEA